MKNVIVLVLLLFAAPAWAQAPCAESPTGQTNCEVFAARDQNALPTPAPNYLRLLGNNAAGIACPTPGTGDAIWCDTTTGTSSTAMTITYDGAFVFQPKTNSTTAWSLNNATGTPGVNFDSTNSRLGVGNIAPGAQLHVTSNAAATIGQIVKGAASQSANLQEWQDSTGAVKASVGNAGNITVNEAAGGTMLALNAGGGGWSGINLTHVDKASIFLGATAGPPNGATLATSNAFPLYFITNNNIALLIDTSQRIGIGTTSPSQILSLGGGAARTINVETNPTPGAAGNNLALVAGGGYGGPTPTPDRNGGTLQPSGGAATGAGTSAIDWLVAKLPVAAATPYPTATPGGTAANAASVAMRIDGRGHLTFVDSVPPAISSCGTGTPAAVGTDNAGRLTLGTGTPSSCVLTFHRPWIGTPICQVQVDGTHTANQEPEPTTTSTTLTLTAHVGNFADGEVMTWMCFDTATS